VIQIVLWVINPLSTQLKGHQTKNKKPGCLSRLITPRVNNPNSLGCLKNTGYNPKMDKFVNCVLVLIFNLSVSNRRKKFSQIERMALISLKISRGYQKF